MIIDEIVTRLVNNRFLIDEIIKTYENLTPEKGLHSFSAFFCASDPRESVCEIFAKKRK